MNKNYTTALLALVLSAAGRAQTPAPAAAAAAPAVAVTATGAFVSDYMFRGQRLNGAGFQPTIEVAAGDFTAGVWGNFVLKDKVPDSSDPEIDLYASYTIALGKDLTLVPGATAYFYPSAPTQFGFYKSTFEPNLALNYSVEGVKFTPKVYYDMTLEGATWELTVGYAIPMKDIGSELGLAATFGTFLLDEAANNTTPSVKSWGDYWQVGGSLPFQLSKDSKLTVGLAYAKGSNAYTKQGTAGKTPNALAVGRSVVTLAYSLSF